MGNYSTHPTRLTFTLVDHKRTAEILLQEAEKVDFYLEECYDDKSNLLARKKMTYMANSISPEDAAHYRLVLAQAYDQIPARLQMDLKEVNMISLLPSADGGMPHTRPTNLICFPLLSQLSSITTLIHELWHVHQRQYQNQWLSIFEQLGWKPWNGLIPVALDRYRRYNPDTIDSPFWIYQDQWIPLPIFKDITQPSVSEVDIWFYHPHQKYHVKNVPTELRTSFPDLPLSAYEHPRELTAYLLSEPNRYQRTPGFITLRGLVGQLSISNK